MLNNIKRQFKFHRASTVFIILSYTITIIFISVGISYLNESRNLYLDNNSGDTKKSLMISIEFDKSFQVDNFIYYIVNKNYKYDIKTYSTAKVGNNDIVVWGHYFQNKPYWQPPLLNGDYFESDEYSNKKVAVVGSNLKKNCFFENGYQYIILDGDKFSVVGFIGRKNREIHLSNTVYIPMEYLNKNMISHLAKKGELQLRFLSNTKITNAEVDNIVNDFKNEFNTIKITKMTNSDNDSISSSLLNVLMVSSLIFIVSIVNIIAMTLFWILDKRKEIAVRKVLGFTDGNIIKLILKEMIELGIISIIFAFTLQLILNIIINHFLKVDMSIEINNVIISISVILVSILITSISPIKVILNVKLTENLNL